MHRRLLKSCAVCAGLAFLVLPLAGCYQNVIGARGVGTEHYEVHESAQDNIVLGNWTGEGRKDRP